MYNKRLLKVESDSLTEVMRIVEGKKLEGWSTVGGMRIAHGSDTPFTQLLEKVMDEATFERALKEEL